MGMRRIGMIVHSQTCALEVKYFSWRWKDGIKENAREKTNRNAIRDPEINVP